MAAYCNAVSGNIIVGSILIKASDARSQKSSPKQSSCSSKHMDNARAGKIDVRKTFNSCKR